MDGKYQVIDDFCSLLVNDIDCMCVTSSFDELRGRYLLAVKHLSGIYETALVRVMDLQKGDLDG